jgi:hypothetical protein
LESPAVDLDLPSIQSVSLDFGYLYVCFDAADATIEGWDGSTWQLVYQFGCGAYTGYSRLNVPEYAVGNSEFRLRFNYQNVDDDGWYAVDDVGLVVDLFNECFTASAPSPVPAGEGGTAPLLADRLSPDGDVIQVSWDSASCPADGYNLLFGDLSALSSATLSGSVCAVGSSGGFLWSPAPEGDLFFLLVGTDGLETESSWGKSSLGERNGLTASGECGVTMKNISNVCE